MTAQADFQLVREDPHANENRVDIRGQRAAPFTHEADQFAADFQQWRASRPQWQTFLSAIKRDRPSEDIQRAAAAAGATKAETAELCNLRLRAKRLQRDAESFPALDKKLQAMNRQQEDLEAIVASKKTGPQEYEAAQQEIGRLYFARRELLSGPWAGAKSAWDCVQVAKESGVL